MQRASRKDLSQWLTQLSGKSVPTNGMEKHCSNGSMYCSALESIFPGTVDMRKVNEQSHAEADALANMRVLQAGFEKINMQDKIAAIDPTALAHGQPIATMELLQTLHALRGGDTGKGGGGKGLSVRDPNVMESAAAGRKRRAAEKAGARTKRKPAEEEEVAAPTEAPAPPPPTPAPTAAAVAELRAQLEAASARHLAEVAALRDERDFYYRKLELIEDAVACADADLAAHVTRALYMSEAEVDSAA